jgi:predicted alpha/beta hydrolase family esterase
MKKVLILHGREGTPKSNWLPRLSKELEKKWLETIIPKLTNTNYPVYEKQYNDIKNIKLKSWDLIVWHSLGCKLAINFIEKNNISWIDVILVAPVYNNLVNELWKELFWDAFSNLEFYVNIENNFKNINKLNNNYTIFLSDNDKYINKLSAKKYYWSLKNIKFIELKNKWHFMDLKLQEILKYIKIWNTKKYI